MTTFIEKKIRETARNMAVLEFKDKTGQPDVALQIETYTKILKQTIEDFIKEEIKHIRYNFPDSKLFLGKSKEYQDTYNQGWQDRKHDQIKRLQELIKKI